MPEVAVPIQSQDRKKKYSLSDITNPNKDYNLKGRIKGYACHWSPSKPHFLFVAQVGQLHINSVLY